MEDLEKQLEELKTEAEKNLKGWQRAVADLENYQRRDEEHHAELLAFGQEQAIHKFLGVLEDIDRILLHIPEGTDETFRQGLEGVRKRFHDTLSELGVEKVKTEGEAFNPEHHEAVAQIEGKDDNVVAQEISPGYRRGKKLLKPAQVKVYKKN